MKLLVLLTLHVWLSYFLNKLFQHDIAVREVNNSFLRNYSWFIRVNLNFIITLENEPHIFIILKFIYSKVCLYEMLKKENAMWEYFILGEICHLLLRKVNFHLCNVFIKIKMESEYKEFVMSFFSNVGNKTKLSILKIFKWDRFLILY